MISPINQKYLNAWEQFIESEKNNSEFFLRRNQILNVIFDIDEYLFLKPLFEGEEISEILKVIDDVIRESKNVYVNKYLVLGDFLFSMTSYGLRDPSNFIFKCKRSDYIRRVGLRAIINSTNLDEISPVNYLNLHKKLLIGLRLDKILERTQIRSVKDDVWGTVIYMQLKTNSLSLNHIGYSKTPFIVVKINNSSYSVGSFRNIWQAKRRKKEMVDVLLPYDNVIKANQTALILCSKLYELNKEYIEKNTNEMLNNHDCENIESYFKKIKSVLKDMSYSESLLNDKGVDINTDEFVKLHVEMKKEYILLIKDLQKIVSIYILKKHIYDKRIFLPSFIDNRGRIYYGTLISPTFYKVFRYLYRLEEKNIYKNLENSIFYNKIIKYDTLEFIDPKKTYISIIFYIEIGKFFIDIKNEYIVKTVDIIKCGIENYKKRNINLELEDVLYVRKIYMNLDKLINNDDIDNDMLIFKDATASGLQNYGILLGYKEEKLKYLNIDGDDWCDTYQYLINIFLNGNDKDIYKRKYLKGTIMTIPYNSVWYSCFRKFLEKLKNNGFEYAKLDEKIRKEIRETHKNFYNNIKKNVKKEFYLNETGKLKNFLYDKWNIDSKKEYKINYKKVRDKYTHVFYKITSDDEASKKALEANNMHSLDARLVSEVIKNFDVITIHDCFGIRLCELHLVMDKINRYYSEIIKKETYSIHIIK